MLVCCSSITVHQQHCSSLSSSFPSTTSSIIYHSARSFLACSPTCLLPPDIYNWFSIANNNHAHTAAYDSSSTPPLLFPIIIICCPQKPNISRAVFPFPHSHIPGGTPQSPASPSLVDRTGASSACPTATKQFDGSTRRTNTVSSDHTRQDGPLYALMHEQGPEERRKSQKSKARRAAHCPAPRLRSRFALIS